jgi:hypothetical protein
MELWSSKRAKGAGKGCYTGLSKPAAKAGSTYKSFGAALEAPRHPKSIQHRVARRLKKQYYGIVAIEPLGRIVAIEPLGPTKSAPPSEYGLTALNCRFCFLRPLMCVGFLGGRKS